MASLDRDLRKQLERAVRLARGVAEEGAEKAIEQLGVGDAEAPRHLKPEQKELRKRLRAHGRQLGDDLNGRTGVQETWRLVAECAYEHWHRMLFARFLAENDLLIEPESGMAISLQDALELAREKSTDWLALASDYAERMLPQIFRKGDPVLEIVLPPEARSQLEDLLKELPRDVFVADDSLGWVYQFWQADRKDEVNDSGDKIGADELPAVTQLFTEDYMVLFLLHNTLGAWWAGKVLAKNSRLAATATSEDELRVACQVGDVDWTYLRFVRDTLEGGSMGPWRPAAGTFDVWPTAAKDVTVLDPCMGSGHFLTFALPILVALRIAEDGLSRTAAVQAVLKDNLFGLELDPRCTQIGAFNLALAAWRRVGHCALPAMNLACSGLAPNAKKEAWLALAGDNERLRTGMEGLYRLFQDAPELGSLINPRVSEGNLLVAEFHELQPLLDKAMTQEAKDDTGHEVAVTARGLAKAAEILAGQFTLVATNVPYLGRGKQTEIVREYCELVYPEAKADLATCFLQRCLALCSSTGSVALVTPQNWLFLGTYKQLRKSILAHNLWNTVARLGAKAFQTPMWDFNVCLVTISRQQPSAASEFAGWDVSENWEPETKAENLRTQQPSVSRQDMQLRNPDYRVSLGKLDDSPLLSELATSLQGTTTGDNPKFLAQFWELPEINADWDFFQGAVSTVQTFGGCDSVIRWENGAGDLSRSHEARVQGLAAFGKRGIVVSQMGSLPATRYAGRFFSMNTAVLLPKRERDLAAIWCFCESPEFNPQVRAIDQALKVTNASLVKVPFDLSHWKKIAEQKYPQGLPKPFSSDQTQWLFNGYPVDSDQPLQVAVARLVGYKWPRQTGSSFLDCPALAPDGLENHADDDGIVPISATRGEGPADDRLRELLACAYGNQWNTAKLEELLTRVDNAGGGLDDWLRNKFFEQHCTLFYNRPFIWHIWDGLRDGFHALINYHRLAAPNGEGKRHLQALIYSYLGDWITRQRADQQNEVDGADARLAHAVHLQEELIKILEGEPPYDIFVRWKPLHEQAIGWEPDINDGVRPNVRPFMSARTLNARGATSCILRTTPKSIKWDKDRGKEPMREKSDYPWFWGWDEEAEDFTGGRDFDGNRWNDLHYSNAMKQAARDRHMPKAKGKK